MNTLIKEVIDTLEWSMQYVNHIDVSLPEHARGVHATLEGNCPLCKKLRVAKRVLAECRKILENPSAKDFSKPLRCPQCNGPSVEHDLDQEAYLCRECDK